MLALFYTGNDKTKSTAYNLIAKDPVFDTLNIVILVISYPFRYILIRGQNFVEKKMTLTEELTEVSPSQISYRRPKRQAEFVGQMSKYNDRPMSTSTPTPPPEGRRQPPYPTQPITANMSTQKGSTATATKPLTEEEVTDKLTETEKHRKPSQVSE